MTEINMVDFAVFGLLLVSAFIGVARGFTREVLGVASWLGAFFAALYGLVWVRPLLAPYIKSPFVADVVAGLILFVVALFILGTISRSISSKVKGSVLGGLDRSLGFVFGVARGGVILVISYLICSVIWKVEKWPEEIKTAKSYSYVLEGADMLRTAIPDDAIKNFGIKAGLKEKDEEQPSLDGVVSALSQPKAAAGKEKGKDEPKKDDGYSDAHRGDMERLVKNNDKDET